MGDKSLLDILAEKGIELQKEGSVTRAFCPFHNDTGRPNFTVYPTTDSWFCFACNMGGDAIAFLAKFENKTYKQVKEEIKGIGIDLTSLQESIDGLLVPDEEPKLNNELNILISKMIRQYLKDHPDKLASLLPIMKNFDQKLLLPINTQKMSEIIAELRKVIL
jgi:DNA primase